VQHLVGSSDLLSTIETLVGHLVEEDLLVPREVAAEDASTLHLAADRVELLLGDDDGLGGVVEEPALVGHRGAFHVAFHRGARGEVPDRDLVPDPLLVHGEENDCRHGRNGHERGDHDEDRAPHSEAGPGRRGDR